MDTKYVSNGPKSSPPQARRRLLLLDDSRTSREVLKVYVMGSNYDFTEADNAQRALMMLRVMKCDLVLADLNIPGMDGLEFCVAVRKSELPTMREVPIILITSDKASDLPERARLAGANEVLRKPVDAERLKQSIERLIGRAPHAP